MEKETILRTLTIQSFHVEDVMFGDEFKLIKKENTYDLIIPTNYKEYLTYNELIKSIDIRIIEPTARHTHVDSIMDIFPISTKALGKLGSGITRTLTGVYGLIAGSDEDGNQVCAFGNSDGFLDEQVIFNKPGTPGDNDYIIVFDCKLKSKAGFSRSGPDSVHKAIDDYCQNIRALLKNMKSQDATEKHTFNDKIRADAKKVVLVKLVSGQGAMYDTHYMPQEPSGFNGGRSIIDSEGSPIMLTPNEYRDGALRALY